MREVGIERREKVARWIQLLVVGCWSRGEKKNWGRNWS